MKVLVVGGGGREHAIAWRLAQETSRPDIFCAPGNAGTASVACNLPIPADDIPALLAWARENRPDLTVVGPEAPLCLGITDAFAAEGLRVFGPSKAAAQMEGSKRFAKEIMNAAGVPTARALTFDNAESAVAALDSFTLPVVIKADGLAAGKGVVIAQTREEAADAIRSMLVDGAFGSAGAQVLIEEFLEGEEASILALVDGEHAVLLPPSQDHKRVFNADQGPNTGGMGAYSPTPVVTPDMLPTIKERIILPVVRELKRRGIVYKGVLYAGLMIGPKGIFVLEFNARFGDPETEAVLPRIGGDLLPALEACVDGTLTDDLVQVRPEAAATVILAAGGYPGSYRKGLPISGLDQVTDLPDLIVFHAGTALKEGQVVTAGGRVLAVTALGADLRAAVSRAYEAVSKIHFDGVHYRTDIAHRAFDRG
ncbi:MAG TPA: phosphoribosylamine--glycine ligase [Kiritimatiellia bacterium]|nr:phosphoribosylamine--glycine ligase [Kiritimatiellia bacterium]HRU70972.1 phosphoribosylamine--glycine ligase [Kiritimatiellia bacterium]